MNADKALELARLAYPNDENLRVAYMLGVDKGYEFCHEQMLKDAIPFYKILKAVPFFERKNTRVIIVNED